MSLGERKEHKVIALPVLLEQLYPVCPPCVSPQSVPILDQVWLPCSPACVRDLHLRAKQGKDRMQHPLLSPQTSLLSISQSLMFLTIFCKSPGCPTLHQGSYTYLV